MTQCQCIVAPDFDGLYCQKVFQICQIARLFSGTELTIRKGERSSSGTSLIGLISLLIRNGDCLTIAAAGTQEEQALSRIESVLMGASVL